MAMVSRTILQSVAHARDWLNHGNFDGAVQQVWRERQRLPAWIP
jgi:hypothetical protein